MKKANQFHSFSLTTYDVEMLKKLLSERYLVVRLCIKELADMLEEEKDEDFRENIHMVLYMMGEEKESLEDLYFYMTDKVK